MPTIGQAKATLVDKIDSLTAAATAKDTIYLAKALKENTSHHSFTFQGAWAATTAYALDDVVTNGGNTYICIAAHTSGASFSVGSNWTMMAGKGTDGTTVGTGTAGQVLKTNAAGNGIEWGEGLPSGGSVGQVIKKDGSNNPGWAADVGGKVLKYEYFNIFTAGNNISTSSTSPQQVGSNPYYFTPTKVGSRLVITLNHRAYQDRGNQNTAYMHATITLNSGSGSSSADTILYAHDGVYYGSGVDHERVGGPFESTYVTTSTSQMQLRVFYWSNQGRTMYFHHPDDHGKPSYFTITEYDV